MSEPETLDPRDLDRLVLTNPKGDLIACVGMLATFYVENAHMPGPRLRIGRFVDRYLGLVSSHLIWALTGEAKLVDLKRYPIGSIIPRIQSCDARRPFSLQLSGAVDFDHASPYSLECYMPFQRPNKTLGYVTATFPLAFLEARGNGFFFDWVRAACEELAPLHGYAGLALIRSMDAGAQMAADVAIYPLAARFPGLEVDEPVAHCRYLAQGIKGVNWLTVVGDRLLGRIGGRSEVRARLGGAITVHDYPTGLIVQAGPFPQIGDNEAGFVPERYREVYSVLKPLQVDYPDVLIQTPKPIDAMRFKDHWMTRFD